MSTSGAEIPPGPPNMAMAATTTLRRSKPGIWRALLLRVQVQWVKSLIKLRPLHLDKWRQHLLQDPDQGFLLYVVEHGLCLTEETARIAPYNVKNYSSICKHRAHVAAALAPDIESRRIPPPAVGMTSLYIHALGAVPKTANSVRVIHDLSRPIGRALNEHMQEVTFQFESLDDAIALMKPGCYMAKVDIEGAYRHVPICPLDWEKLAFLGPNGVEFWDGFLPFGTKIACEVFNRFGAAIKRMMACLDIRCIIVYVDDFLIVAATPSEIWRAYFALRALLLRLGFLVNMKLHKSVPPSQICTFLGIESDSVLMEASLDAFKLSLTLSLSEKILRKKAIKRRNLESVAGKLNSIAKVVYGGRTFLRQISMLSTLSATNRILFLSVAAFERIYR
jgi:hypothetical protein